MRKYIIVFMVFAFMACEKTFIVGGTVTDILTEDSIEGLEMGLYVLKESSSDYTDKKWSDLELIETATTNSNGFFSMELDDDFSMSSTIFLPLAPTDTLSVNAQYTPRSSEGLQYAYYSPKGDFKLKRSSHILFILTNFTQAEVLVRCGDFDALNSSLTYSPYLSFRNLLTGQEYKFDFYEIVDDDNPKYLGSKNLYIKTQLPAEPEKVFWEMTIQEIEIDYNTLEE
ncbi:MAG: hypothetical protein JXR50_11470 [Prolixibacteraceae bacterium]|nr:hypothetical protein [Prolixibacteraceae bacterium]MBN2650348.1 hypothetical protein [Prolixibacteraceae bacterium]